MITKRQEALLKEILDLKGGEIWHKGYPNTQVKICDGEHLKELIESFTPAEKDRAWVPINSVEDLPKEAGEYLWQRADGKSRTHSWYTPGISDDHLYLRCLAWMPIPPYVPTKGESDER
jgi:hypothetical protein